MHCQTLDTRADVAVPALTPARCVAPVADRGKAE